MKSRALLLCGAIASIWYLAVNIIVPTQYPGYDWMSQTVSELSAVDAPTRQLWVLLCLPYNALMIAFGCGIWLTSGANKTIKWTGAIVMAGAIIGAFWPPMHQREVLATGGGTLTDTLHIAFTMAWGVFSLATMALAAFALRSRSFGLITGAMALATVGFGALTGIDAPNMEKNLPTPLMGLWERLGMVAFMAWVAVFAVALLRSGATTRKAS